jgi:hypothetical protein
MGTFWEWMKFTERALWKAAPVLDSFGSRYSINKRKEKTV